MANAGVFETGYQQGFDVGSQPRLLKQQRQEQEFLQRNSDLLSQRDSLQQKLSTLKDANGKPLPGYDETLSALEQNVKDIHEHWHPDKSPGMISKFGHLLTNAVGLTKPQATETMVIPNPKGMKEAGNLPIWNRPAVQNADGSHSSEYSVSFQDPKTGYEVLVPTVVDGKFLTPDGKKPKEGSPEEKAMFQAAWKHYLDTGQNLGKFATPADADAYAQVLHNRGTMPKNIQKGEAKTAAQTAADKKEAESLAAAAPLSPAQVSAEQTITEIAKTNAANDATIAWLKRNNAPQEVIDQAIANAGGGVARGSSVKPDVVPLTLGDGSTISAQWEPAEKKWQYLDRTEIPAELLQGARVTPKPSKLTNIDEERESYRKDHGIPSGQPLTFKQEQDFLKQVALARNPFGPARIGMEREGLDLREQEAGFKDFLNLQKQLTPLERIISTSNDSTDLVVHPTGPGDVKLTLAFFDAIKTTGVRFTKQEQDFIIGSRGFMDGVQAKFDSGFAGTVFSPAQRALIASIVKKAGDTAAQQKNTIVSGAATFRPSVAAAATKSGPPTASPQTGVPAGATHIVHYEGKDYYVDKDGNNLGEKK